MKRLAILLTFIFLFSSISLAQQLPVELPSEQVILYPGQKYVMNQTKLKEMYDKVVSCQAVGVCPQPDIDYTDGKINYYYLVVATYCVKSGEYLDKKIIQLNKTDDLVYLTSNLGNYYLTADRNLLSRCGKVIVLVAVLSFPASFDYSTNNWNFGNIQTIAQFRDVIEFRDFPQPPAENILTIIFNWLMSLIQKLISLFS